METHANTKCGFIELYIVAVDGLSDAAKGAFIVVKHEGDREKTSPAAPAQVSEDKSTIQFLESFKIWISDLTSPIEFKLEGCDSPCCATFVPTAKHSLKKTHRIDLIHEKKDPEDLIAHLTIALQFFRAPTPTGLSKRLIKQQSSRVVFDRLSYRPGAVIHGYVALANVEAVEVTTVVLEFAGSSRVYWKLLRHNAPHHPSNSYDAFEYEKENLCCRSQVPGRWPKAENDHSSTTVIPAGLHFVPFNFYLPTDLPPTMERHKATVEYACRLLVAKAGEPQHSIWRAPLIVESQLPPGEFEQEIPLKVETKNFSIDGAVNNVMIIGRPFHIAFEVHNTGSSRIDGITIGIDYVHTSIAMENKNIRGRDWVNVWEHSDSLCCSNLSLKLEPGSKTNIETTLTIPPENVGIFSIPKQISPNISTECVLKVGKSGDWAKVGLYVMNWSSQEPLRAAYSFKPGSLVFYPRSKDKVIVLGGVVDKSEKMKLSDGEDELVAQTSSGRVSSLGVPSRRTSLDSTFSSGLDFLSADTSTPGPSSLRRYSAKSTSSTDSTRHRELFTCRRCRDPNVDCVFLDCAHSVLCYSCAQEKKPESCPICNQPIKNMMRIYRY